jgi:hypothetical protein
MVFYPEMRLCVKGLPGHQELLLLHRRHLLPAGAQAPPVVIWAEQDPDLPVQLSSFWATSGMVSIGKAA